MATQVKTIPGSLIVRQSGGSPGSDEVTLFHDGTNGTLATQNGNLILENSTNSITISGSSVSPNAPGALNIGDSTNYYNTLHATALTSPGVLTINDTGGILVNGATGGAQGDGTINTTGIFVNGVAVTAGVSNLDDLGDVTITTVASGDILYYDGSNFVNEGPGATSGVQAHDANLDDISGLTPTDGNIIVGDGSNFIAESGNTARTSLGLGTGDDVTFNSLTTATIDRGSAGTVSLFTDAGANNITVGGSTSTLVVSGNLQVDGTTTTVNSTTLDVADANITINNGGNTASTTGAGINIEGDSAAVVGYFRVDASDNSLIEIKAPTGNELLLDINTDVEIEINSLTTDDILQFDGTKFVNVPLVLDKALDDLTDVVITTQTSGDILYFNGTNWVNEGPGATSGVQAHDAQLDNISSLTPADGTIIVGDGSDFVAESGNTARTSLGLGDADDVTHATLSLLQGANNSQSVMQVAYNTTTNASQTELFLDGSSARLVLPNDSTWLFDIKLVARRTDVDGESAAYKLSGAIDRNANAASTALIGAIEETSNEDTAAWDVEVDADTTNGSLRIRVTGEASKTIKWVAFVNYVEVIG